MIYNREHINRTAEKILKEFLNWIEKESLIESIYDSYVRACQEALKKFGVEPKELSVEMLSRLKFEILCFGPALAILLAPQCFNIFRGIFRRQTHGKEGKLLFRDCMWSLRNDIVNELRLNEFGEIILKRIDPQIQYGLGDPLSFDKRCNEYAEAFGDKDHSEIEVFGKKVGMSLDPEHYPVLSIIGGHFAIEIARFIAIELSDHFKDQRTE